MEKNKDLVNELIGATIDRLEKIESFTLEQAPDLCKEIVLAEKVSIENSIIVASIASFLFIMAAVGCLVGVDEVAPRYILTFFPATIALVSIGQTLECALSLRVLKAAPKALILQKLRGM